MEDCSLIVIVFPVPNIKWKIIKIMRNSKWLFNITNVGKDLFTNAVTLNRKNMNNKISLNLHSDTVESNLVL